MLDRLINILTQFIKEQLVNIFALIVALGFLYFVAKNAEGISALLFR
jgi:hypothetical protein